LPQDVRRTATKRAAGRKLLLSIEKRVSSFGGASYR
jgi:hypothetical protein